jgi:hypothetical protein
MTVHDKVGAPVREGFDDCQKFLFIDVVVLFHGGEGC